MSSPLTLTKGEKQNAIRQVHTILAKIVKRQTNDPQLINLRDKLSLQYFKHQILFKQSYRGVFINQYNHFQKFDLSQYTNINKCNGHTKQPLRFEAINKFKQQKIKQYSEMHKKYFNYEKQTLFQHFQSEQKLESQKVAYHKNNQSTCGSQHLQKQIEDNQNYLIIDQQNSQLSGSLRFPECCQEQMLDDELIQNAFDSRQIYKKGLSHCPKCCQFQDQSIVIQNEKNKEILSTGEIENVHV